MKKRGEAKTAEAQPPAPVAALVTSAPKKAVLPETTEGFPWMSNHEVKKETNPFTERDLRMRIYAWFGMAVRVLLVFGGLFSVFQFLAAREEKRVERSLALVELWENDDYQQAERALKQRLVDLNAKYANILGDNPTAADRAVLLERIGMEAFTPNGGTLPLAEFQQRFDRIVYFLNRVAFCIEGDLCTRTVIDPYFRDYAASFWRYFGGYIARQRHSGMPSYAMPIENYLRGSRSIAPAPAEPVPVRSQ